MGKREPTPLTRLLRALAMGLAIAVLFNTRVLSLWAGSIKDAQARALFSSVIAPLSRLIEAHGLPKAEAGMNGIFRLALAGSSDGSSVRIGRAPAQNAPEPGETPLPGMASPNGGGARAPESNPDGTVPASDSVFYPDYYRSFSFSPEPAESRTRLRDILFIGDSLLGSMALSLKRSAPEHPDYSIQLEYGISSALVQSVYCDWQKRLERLLEESRYDYIVVFLGANDGIGIHTGGTDLPFDSEAWRNEYQGRVRSLLGTMEGKAKRIFWLGTPPMRKPGYRDRMKRINELIAQICAEFPKAEFLDLAPLLGDAAGRYRAAMPLDGELKTVRADDGIHFSQAGARLLTDFVFGRISEDENENAFGGRTETDGFRERLSWESGPARVLSP